MSEYPRLPRFFVWIGVGFALTLPVIAIAIAVAATDEPALAALPRAVAVSALSLLPAAVALLGLRHRRRALLATAAVLGLLVGFVLVPVGLLLWVSTVAWAQAASRVPGATKATRPAPIAVLVAGTVVLALAGGATLFVHQDPTCWDYVEDEDGGRTYGPAESDPSQPSGFGRPAPTTMGSEVSDPVEIDPETGAPLDPDATASGRVCVSDRITAPQGGVSVLLTLSAGAFAGRFGRPRADRSAAAR